MLLFSYGYFVQPPSWNENSRFDLTRSLVERGRVDIDPHHHNTGDKSFHDGHHYSDKAPGTSLLAAPVYAAYYGYLRLTGGSPPASIAAAGKSPDELEYLVNPSFRHGLYICNLFTNALAGAALGALFFWLLVTRLAVAPRLALTATLALGLGSLVLPYATMLYGHVLAAFFLFAAFATVGDGPSARRLAGAGALAGLAVLTELPAAPAALLVGAYACWRARRRGLWFAVGLAGPLLVLLAYQYAAFGSAFRPGYAMVARPEFAEGMSRGVMGVGLPRPRVLAALLFGRARGLLYLSPILALAFVGLARRAVVDWRARRPEALLAAAVVVYFLLMNAGYYMWYGGSALGPRHLIPALPFLCLGLPFAFRARPAALALAGVLLAISITNQVAATAVEPAAPFVADVLRDHVYRHLLRGEVAVPVSAANLGTLIGLPGPASLLPLLGVWALALPVLLPLLPRAEGETKNSPPE
jgi:hypothetical protein